MLELFFLLLLNRNDFGTSTGGGGTIAIAPIKKFFKNEIFLK